MARNRRSGQTPRPRKDRGKWKIWYRKDVVDAEGNHRRVQTTRTLGAVGSMTFTQACGEARKFLQPVNDLETGVEYSSRTMNDLVERWRGGLKTMLKKSSQRNYEWSFGKVSATFGDTPVKQLERADVQEFLIEHSCKLSSRSVRDLRTNLKTLLGLAVEWGWVAENVATGRFHLPGNTPKRPKRVLAPAEVNLYIASLPEPYSTMVALAVFTGLRAGEIGALLWKDVTDTSVQVNRAVYRGEVGSPKSRASQASVPLTSRVSSMLQAWRRQTRFPKDNDYVFAGRVNKPKNMDNVATWQLRPVAKKLGLGVVSWHDLRHTFCTLGRQSGVSPESMQKLMRHASVVTTLMFYSHVGTLDDVSKIDQFVSPGVSLDQQPVH